MSLRNKKLTALQNINYAIQRSLNKSHNSRLHSNQDKIQKKILQKIGERSMVRRFQVKKMSTIQPQIVQRKTKYKSLRIHTEKFISPKKKKQDEPHQRSHTIPMKQAIKEETYPNLTPFETDEVLRYEIYYIGTRRISSNKDFTSNTCEAKVQLGDSIAYRYEVISLLGQGSFGQVFKSFDHKKKELVALKIIRNQHKFNKQAKVQIKILQNVMIFDPKFKSNIVQLKHAFFFRGHACLVFQLLHINLYQLSKQLKFKGLQMDMLRRISIQVLQGLLFLHRQDIIHCDLKPQNILLKQQNKSGIKIIDLGSGCFQKDQIYTYIQSRFYRAPEVILGMPYTSAIDIWSMGCILCQLFLGYPVFPGQNEQQQMLMFIEVLGMPPLSFIQRGSRSSKFFQSQSVKMKPNSKGKIRKPNSKPLELVLGSSEDQDFISFVRSFFLWETKQRITALQALVHPWILKGLPFQIRKQHISTLNKQWHH